METGVMFYQMDPPYIYEDLVQHRFYVEAVEIRTQQISVSSFEEPLTTSISGPTSIGQTSSMSAKVPPEIVEISDDEDEDPEECSDVIVIFSDDDS
ncbi:hypothetical protein AHAS_Ahas13G0142300 [Arachis hypogaea]